MTLQIYFISSTGVRKNINPETFHSAQYDARHHHCTSCRFSHKLLSGNKPGSITNPFPCIHTAIESLVIVVFKVLVSPILRKILPKSTSWYLGVGTVAFSQEMYTSYTCIVYYINYIQGLSKKFVHWCYNFLTTNDIELIFGDLLIF